MRNGRASSTSSSPTASCRPLELLRIPNNHTAGTTVGSRTPQSYVAENDLYVGEVVDAVSHSPYWKNTLIVVTEDDAQNGPDHVDGHRTTSLIISGYNSHSQLTVDHTLYDTASMVRTVELVLGLKPLSQYDAEATPMWRFLGSTFDPAPFSVVQETIGPTVLNTKTSPGAALSATLNFQTEDRAPAGILNRITWSSVKGAKSPYPVSHYSSAERRRQVARHESLTAIPDAHSSGSEGAGEQLPAPSNHEMATTRVPVSALRIPPSCAGNAPV